MKKELNILVIFFVLAVTPLALYFSQQQQTTQQRASEPTPTVAAPTLEPTATPVPTVSSAPTVSNQNSKITPYPTFTPAVTR